MKNKFPKILLHIEGVFMFISSTFIYFQVDGSFWLYIILFLIPDIGMLGYFTKSKKIGSYTYNLFHTYSIPIILGGCGFFISHIAMLISMIWLAHIGIDRAFGYGLKYETGFKDTHLQKL